MKAERRQELKTNELSLYLRELREYFRQHASTITIVAVGAVLLAAALAYRNHAEAQSREQAWQNYQEAMMAALTPVPDNPAWKEEAFGKLEGIIAEGPDAVVVAETRWQLAQFCLRQFQDSTDPQERAKLLDRAEEQCKAILNSRPSKTLRGAALNGLVSVEQNRFVLDGDLKHRDNARQYLEQLREGKEFLGTVFQTDALARLNNFDKLWKPLVLAEPPVGPPTPAEGAGSTADDNAEPATGAAAEPAATAPPSAKPATEEKPGQEEDDQAGDEAVDDQPSAEPEQP